jgi:hypothetical protein
LRANILHKAIKVTIAGLRASSNGIASLSFALAVEDQLPDDLLPDLDTIDFSVVDVNGLIVDG